MNDYYITRLQELLNKEAVDHGTFGFRLTTPANKDSQLAQIAGEAVRMHESFLAGDYTELTGTEL